MLPGSRALGGEPRGELAALRWQDIEEDWLHVRQNMVAVGELVPSAPKTKAGRRDIPLAIEPQFGAALREHRKRQLADRLAAGSGWTDTGLILAGPHGELIPPWRLSTRWTELVEVSGLPKIVLHGARKTANSTWAASGVDLAVRSCWGGWSRQGMADGVYLNIRPEVHREAARKVAAYKAEYAPSSAAL